MNKRVPYRLDCEIVGRFRLLPEVVETLDFNAKSAYKLVPTSTLKKQDQRQFFRYTLKNYGDSRIPLTTHIGFDLYIRKTDQTFPKQGTPPVILKDIVPIDFNQVEGGHQFATHDAINAFREIMLKKQPRDRKIYATKAYNANPNNPMVLSIYGDALIRNGDIEAGIKVFEKITDIKEQVEIVDVFRPSAETVDIAKDTIKIGAKVLWLQLGIKDENAQKLVEANKMKYIENKCTKIEYQKYFL